jgi:5-methylcytosine-specific restriction endonuclease McrA
MVEYSNTTLNRLQLALQVSDLRSDDSRQELFPDLLSGDSVPQWRGEELGITTFTSHSPCGSCGGQIYVLHQNNVRQGRHRVKCHTCKLEEPKRNLAAKQARQAMRRAVQKRATPVNLSKADRIRIRQLFEKRNKLTEITGVEHHVDHIIPLSRGGSHHPDNMQVITALENIKKGSKLPGE